MNPQGVDPKLVDALNQASSLELFQLSTLVDRMLRDPRRILAVRTNMHLGQTVRFLDWRTGQMAAARVAAMGNSTVTLFDERTRSQWKLPYAAVEPPGGQGASTPAPPPMPQPVNEHEQLTRCADTLLLIKLRNGPASSTLINREQIRVVGEGRGLF